jgi:hypothetical protein
METPPSEQPTERPEDNGGTGYSGGRQRSFWVLRWPRFGFLRGAGAGFLIGLLVAGLSAGIAALYNAVTSSDLGLYGGGTGFFSSLFYTLFMVVSVTVLVLIAIALPLAIVRGKGWRRAVKVFAAEILIILLALGGAFYGVVRTTPTQEGYCGYETICSPECINCGIDL